MDDEQDKTREVYDRVARRYAQRHINPDSWRPEFETFQKYLPSGKIIEIGCGAGRDALLFLGAGYDYLGTDYSQGMIEEAKKQAPKGKFLVMDMEKLDFPPATFDGFWACATLLHIPKNKIVGVLAGFKKILKPQGVGFISVKEGDGEGMVEAEEWEGEQRFFSFWQLAEFAKVLSGNGFEVLKSYRLTRFDTGTVWLVYFVRANI